MHGLLPRQAAERKVEMRDFLMWNIGWWSMFAIWSFDNIYAKIAAAIASVVLFIFFHRLQNKTEHMSQQGKGGE
jgi:hypothetical protein